MTGSKLRNWMLKMSAALDQIDASWDGLNHVIEEFAYEDPVMAFHFMQTIGSQKTFLKAVRFALSKKHEDCDCESCKIGKEVFGSNREGV